MEKYILKEEESKLQHKLYKCKCTAVPCTYCDLGIRTCTVCSGTTDNDSLLEFCPGQPE